MRDAICAGLLIILTGLATGCGVFPAYTNANEPLVEKDGRSKAEVKPVNRASQFVEIDDLPEKTFVGVAISGGGSRAANFSAAVLQELDQVGFLDHVAMISSVSGGSLTGAYYGLKRPRSRSSWDELRELLGRNFFRSWGWHFVYPHNWVRLGLTDFDRSDVMAGVFNDILFKNAKFEDLHADGPRIVINATDLQNRRFTFTDEVFREKLGSRLDRYPLANAVMASGAFPGVFNDVTLAVYKEPGPGKPESGPRGYQHLYDGGPSDNLGIDTLLDAVDDVVASAWTKGRSLNGCFMFLIDANVARREPRAFKMRDPRRGVDFLFDRNAIDAFDALLWHRRLGQLREIRPNDAAIPSPPAWNFTMSVLVGQGKKVRINCAVWHFTFQRLETVGAADASLGVKEFRQRIGRMASGVETHYKLTGLGCSSGVLQNVLYDAA